MSQSACALLRHDVRPRWIGDLQAAFCHSCGCLWIPEPTDPAPSGLGHPPGPARSGGPPVPAPVAPPPLAVT